MHLGNFELNHKFSIPNNFKLSQAPHQGRLDWILMPPSELLVEVAIDSRYLFSDEGSRSKRVSLLHPMKSLGYIQGRYSQRAISIDKAEFFHEN